MASKAGIAKNLLELLIKNVTDQLASENGNDPAIKTAGKALWSGINNVKSMAETAAFYMVIFCMLIFTICAIVGIHAAISGYLEVRRKKRKPSNETKNPNPTPRKRSGCYMLVVRFLKGISSCPHLRRRKKHPE
jgi:hypothetical protein